MQEHVGAQKMATDEKPNTHDQLIANEECDMVGLSHSDSDRWY